MSGAVPSAIPRTDPGPAGSRKRALSCAWCRELLSATARRDARFCSQRCRQAAHRFTRAVVHDVRHDGSSAMRFAYADPPYPGLADRYYGDHPDFAGEVNHAALVRYLSSPGRFDGWALSTSAVALPAVLALCAGLPVRVAAWIRGGRTNARPRGPLSSWEPVVYAGGRDGSARLDSLTFVARARTTDPDRVVGAKPATFIRWMFELLGAQPGDELEDLFPGSGGVTRAWELYSSSLAESDTSRGSAGDASCASPSDASHLQADDASSRTSSDDPSPGRSATDPSCRAAARIDASCASASDTSRCAGATRRVALHRGDASRIAAPAEVPA